MPVIPTYRAGVGAADLSGAYLGAQRIAQEAYSDAARIQLGREQLAQQAVANEMELAVKREALARQSMKQQQEAEIEKAYRETQIGLRQRELENQEAIAQMRVQDAARDFERQQLYGRRFAELEPKLGAEEAARRAILELGGTGLSEALERPRQPEPRKYNAVVGVDPFGLLPPTRLQMTAPEFQSFMQTAPPQLRTNAPNVAIQGMLQPPPDIGTNQTRTLRVVRDANGKLVIER